MSGEVSCSSASNCHACTHDGCFVEYSPEDIHNDEVVDAIAFDSVKESREGKRPARSCNGICGHDQFVLNSVLEDACLDRHDKAKLFEGRDSYQVEKVEKEIRHVVQVLPHYGMALDNRIQKAKSGFGSVMMQSFVRQKGYEEMTLMVLHNTGVIAWYEDVAEVGRDGPPLLAYPIESLTMTLCDQGESLQVTVATENVLFTVVVTSGPRASSWLAAVTELQSRWSNKPGRDKPQLIPYGV
eukprot:gnl/MRDRNA2_/MRDRNA2_78624_c0_seq2.p1 gnl/MRDRNA2_/MRDRNA2_78624_c0~~gnl/MRDRNA2_/MRDRNA2_78624_c0_seq2.p1  ORF type:complete len:241 (-),score=30.54 gnl/MRDRNA2_/MRDRNA2_78624_c0_seq2:109-831(-)